MFQREMQIKDLQKCVLNSSLWLVRSMFYIKLDQLELGLGLQSPQLGPIAQA